MVDDILKGREDIKTNAGAIRSALSAYATYGPKNPYTNVLSNEELKKIKAEDLVDYTRRDNVAERLVKRFGASIGEGSVRALKTAPSLR